MAGVSVKIDISSARKKLRNVGAKLDRKALLQAIGFRHLKWIDDNFRQSGRLASMEGPGRAWPPLAESTKYSRRQSSDKPLLDTGALRRSFEIRIRGNEVSVGPFRGNSSGPDIGKLAEWHHEGTDPYVIKPKNKKALAFPHPRGSRIIKNHATTRYNGRTGFIVKEVHHPGLPARPLIPTKATAATLAKQVLDAYVAREIARASQP